MRSCGYETPCNGPTHKAEGLADFRFSISFANSENEANFLALLR